MNTINSLLNQLNGADAQNRKIIEAKLKNCFADPLFISNSDYLPDSDSFKTEARTVSDAFEAVTNGMCTDEGIASLETIDADSFFSDWRFLTEALFYLYCGDFEKTEKSISLIRKDSPPSLLVPVLAFLSCCKESDESENPDKLTDIETKLVSEVAKEKFKFAKILKKIYTSLENRDVEIFTDSITLLITDINERNSDISKNLTVWALKQFYTGEMSAEMFLENIMLIYGKTEAYRLGAAAFRALDINLSLMFYIKALLSLISSGFADKLYADIYLEIIAETVSDISEIPEKTLNLLFMLDREISIHFPDLADKYRISNIKTAEKGIKQNIYGKDKRPVQFELFA